MYLFNVCISLIHSVLTHISCLISPLKYEVEWKYNRFIKEKDMQEISQIIFIALLKLLFYIHRCITLYAILKYAVFVYL